MRGSYLKNHPNQQTLRIETNIFQQRATGNYKTVGNYKITPFTVKCQLRSIL